MDGYVGVRKVEKYRWEWGGNEDGGREGFGIRDSLDKDLKVGG